MFNEEIVPLDYWRFIRLGRAKKILEDFEGAIDEYTNALSTSKKLSNAFFHRGNIYSILGKYDLAINDYKEALRKSNNFVFKISLISPSNLFIIFLLKLKG